MSTIDTTTSASSINFINRNIHNFSISRSSSKDKRTRSFTVKGVSVFLYSREKFVEPHKKDSKKPITKQEPVKNPKKKETVRSDRKLNEQNSDRRSRYCPIVTPVHLGVRRTSIKTKGAVFGAKVSPSRKLITDNLTKEINAQKNNHGRKNRGIRIKNNRETLSLPVSWISVPEPQPVNTLKIILEIARRNFQERRKRETIHQQHVQALEKLLANMDLSGKFPHCTDGRRADSAQYIVLDNAEDQSYVRVFQKHVDELNSVIAEDKARQKPGSTVEKRAKKKGPQLQVKILTTEECCKAESENLEEIAASQGVENCGDVTPVITYNHVSTVSSPPEFQCSTTVSPRSSTKGSRSPSPLLEVPPASAEICAKFPTIQSIASMEAVPPPVI